MVKLTVVGRYYQRRHYCVTLADLELLTKLQISTGLTGDDLYKEYDRIRDLPPVEKTYDYLTGGSVYPGKSYKSMGLRKFFEWCYHEVHDRWWHDYEEGQRPDAPPTFVEWMGDDMHLINPFIGYRVPK